MDRQIITFEANEQTLIKTGGLDNYSSNKVSYIEAHFALGQNWAGYDSVRAVWSTRYECISTVLDTEGICVVPYEVLKWKDKVIVNLVGSISENDVLTDRITTYPIKALEVDADAKVCGSNTQPITPSEYEQFVEAVKADADRAEEAKDEARGYASSASTSAGNAHTSEVNASASEDNAKASELNAETYKDQAQTYAQNANNSAISAENAKDEAEDARDTILGMRAEATTLPEGSSATASYNDGVMSFGIPKGDTGARGATGETGATPQLSIGTVTTTTEPIVTITGTAENPVLNFGLVKGDKGDTGEVSLAEMLEQTTIQTNADNEPYLFRATPECGRYEFDEIVGGTVAWNQIAQNGDFADTTGWTGAGNISISASGNVLTATVNDSVGSMYYGVRKTTNFSASTSGHKFFITVDINAPYSGAGIGVMNSTAASNQYTGVANTWSTVCTILNFGTGDHQLQIYVGSQYASYVANDTFKIRNCMAIDLTQMFGSTIADYIYSLETATAGAGVAWFRKLFPKPYYAYDAGTLKHVEGVSSHDMVGFNQWDEEWENGYLNTSGNPVASNSYFRSKNFIKVLPTTYYFKTPEQIGVCSYDENEQFIRINYPNNSTLTFTDDVKYIKFYCGGASYANNVCINLSWDGERDGEYEPYVKHSYPLDDSLTLRGVPKLDSSNNLYYDGDTYESDGTVTRKYKEWSPTTATVSKDTYYSDLTGVACFYFSQPSDAKGYNTWTTCNAVVDKLEVRTYSASARNCIFNNASTMAFMYCSSSADTTAEQAQEVVRGLTFIYELETPTTESADPYQNPQRCEKGGTEEYVSTSIVPIGHNTDYPMTLEDTMPTADGTYSLTVTVSGGKNTVSWS